MTASERERASKRERERARVRESARARKKEREREEESERDRVCVSFIRLFLIRMYHTTHSHVSYVSHDAFTRVTYRI